MAVKNHLIKLNYMYIHTHIRTSFIENQRELNIDYFSVQKLFMFWYQEAKLTLIHKLPFFFYYEVNGVAMGSPLVPTFSNFYM